LIIGINKLARLFVFYSSSSFSSVIFSIAEKIKNIKPIENITEEKEEEE
jgi:hypothetical protein